MNIVPENLRPYVPLALGVIKAVVILMVGWMASQWTRRLTHKATSGRHVDEAVARFVAALARYAVLAAAIIAALGAVGIETTSVVAILASAGLAVGLALQGTLAHFASGVMLLIFRPFRIGDVVTTGGHTGKVVDIGLFATTLHTPDNQKVIIPNGAITGSSIVNITSLGTRCGDITVGIAYGADVLTVIEILRSAAAKTELVLADPAPAVIFSDLGQSALDFKVLAWANSADHAGMLGNLRRSVYDALNEAGVEIPYQQVVIHQSPAERDIGPMTSLKPT